jgi:hypothetical protein
MEVGSVGRYAGKLAVLLLALALLAGCPRRGEVVVPPSQGGQASTAPAAPSAPVFRAGTYQLREEALDRPWFRETAGYLSRSGEGVWEGSLRIDRGVRARFRLTGDGEASGAELTVDKNRDRQLDEKPVAAVSSGEGSGREGGPTRRYVFPALDLGSDTRVTLGAETSQTNPRAVRVFLLQDRCLAATIPTDGEPESIRFLTEADRARLWQDADGNGVPAPWELADTDALVGLGSRLYSVRLDTSNPPSLTLEEYGGPQATVVFDATDGCGRRRGVYAPRVRGTTRAQYVGLVATARMPAGDGGLEYLLPNDDQGACLAYVPRAMMLSEGQEQTIKAGGPVKIDLQARAQREMVDVSLSLATAAGDPVNDGVGGSEQTGTIEIIGADGSVLTRGEAGFG